MIIAPVSNLWPEGVLVPPNTPRTPSNHPSLICKIDWLFPEAVVESAKSNQRKLLFVSSDQSIYGELFDAVANEKMFEIGNQHNSHTKNKNNIAQLQTSRRTPFSLSCDISFAGDATLTNLKVWTVLHLLNITVTTCTHLPTNKHTCSQRSQWRRAIVLARKTRLSTIERGHQVDGWQ